MAGCAPAYGRHADALGSIRCEAPHQESRYAGQGAAVGARCQQRTRSRSRRRLGHPAGERRGEGPSGRVRPTRCRAGSLRAGQMSTLRQRILVLNGASDLPPWVPRSRPRRRRDDPEARGIYSFRIRLREPGMFSCLAKRRARQLERQLHRFGENRRLRRLCWGSRARRRAKHPKVLMAWLDRHHLLAASYRGRPFGPYTPTARCIRRAQPFR